MPVVATLIVLIDAEDARSAALEIQKVLEYGARRHAVLDWESPFSGNADLPGGRVDVPDHLSAEKPRGYLVDLARSTRKH